MSAKHLSQDTLGILFQDRRDFYIAPNVVKELWTDITPFTTIMSNKNAMTTKDPDFKLFEHRSGWIKQQFSATDAGSWSSNGDPGGTITGLPVGSISGLAATADASFKGLQVEIYNSDMSVYKGMALVTDVVSGELTLKSMGNAAASNNRAVNIVSGDIFYVIGTAFGEGTVAPEAFSDDLEVVWNSCQILKTPVEVTGTLAEAALRGYSDELARLRMEKNKEHKMHMERIFLFGHRPAGTGMGASDSFATHQTDADGKIVRTTMGMITALRRYGKTTGDDQNIFNIVANSYTYDDFVDDSEKLFTNIPSSGRKIALCGAKALSYWSKVGQNTSFVSNSGFNVQITEQERHVLGYDFRTLMTPHGKIDLVWAPVLRGPYANKMVIIDPDNVGLVRYRADLYQTNVKTDNAYDGIKDVWMSDVGLWLNLIETHSLWTIQ